MAPAQEDREIEQPIPTFLFESGESPSDDFRSITKEDVHIMVLNSPGHVVNFLVWNSLEFAPLKGKSYDYQYQTWVYYPHRMSRDRFFCLAFYVAESAFLYKFSVDHWGAHLGALMRSPAITFLATRRPTLGDKEHGIIDVSREAYMMEIEDAMYNYGGFQMVIDDQVRSLIATLLRAETMRHAILNPHPMVVN